MAPVPPSSLGLSVARLPALSLVQLPDTRRVHRSAGPVEHRFALAADLSGQDADGSLVLLVQRLLLRGLSGALQVVDGTPAWQGPGQLHEFALRLSESVPDLLLDAPQSLQARVRVLVPQASPAGHSVQLELSASLDDAPWCSGRARAHLRPAPLGAAGTVRPDLTSLVELTQVAAVRAADAPGRWALAAWQGDAVAAVHDSAEPLVCTAVPGADDVRDPRRLRMVLDLRRGGTAVGSCRLALRAA